MSAIIERIKVWIEPITTFFKKTSDDGVFQLSGMLAYSLLFAIAPLMLGILGIASIIYFLLGHSANDLTQLIVSHLHSSPNSSQIASTVQTLQKNAGSLGIVGIVTSIIGGSAFFRSVDYAICIIYRLKQRQGLAEWRMSILMVLVLIPTVVLMLLATSVPQLISFLVSQTGANQQSGLSPLLGIVTWAISLASGVLAAFVLFTAIYIIVPNEKIPFGDIFRGAALAAVLLEIYTLLFPFYVAHFVNPSRYGANLGFALIILGFFYYFAAILLIGGELNSWLKGSRALRGDIPELLHQIDAHGTIVKDGVFPTIKHDHGDGVIHEHTIDDPSELREAIIASPDAVLVDGPHDQRQSVVTTLGEQHARESKSTQSAKNIGLAAFNKNDQPASTIGNGIVPKAHISNEPVLDPRKPTFPVYVIGALAVITFLVDVRTSTRRRQQR